MIYIVFYENFVFIKQTAQCLDVPLPYTVYWSFFWLMLQFDKTSPRYVCLKAFSQSIKHTKQCVLTNEWSCVILQTFERVFLSKRLGVSFSICSLWWSVVLGESHQLNHVESILSAFDILQDIFYAASLSSTEGGKRQLRETNNK